MGDVEASIKRMSNGRWHWVIAKDIGASFAWTNEGTCRTRWGAERIVRQELSRHAYRAEREAHRDATACRIDGGRRDG